MLAMADPVAAARNFLNALERIPSIIDQYKAKNEVLEKEVPQLQEIASKVVALWVVLRVDDGSLVDVLQAPFLSQRVDLGRVADEDDVCHFLFP